MINNATLKVKLIDDCIHNIENYTLVLFMTNLIWHFVYIFS
ncbi:hypothetical protein NSP_38360 [Nodularia spumigena CCY9414]|nr:hypothetical protein NSP_38360 [Nodularia spumigena CCY9414]